MYEYTKLNICFIHFSGIARLCLVPRQAPCERAPRWLLSGIRSGFAKQVCEPHLFVLHIKCMNTFNMQEYRSGHNEAVLKTVCLTARGFESLFLRQNKGTPNRCPFVLLKKRLSNLFFRYYENGVRKSAESHLGACSQGTRRDSFP